MKRIKNHIAMVAIFASVGTAVAQDYFDDIYYDPKKDTSSVTTKIQKQSNYIANMADMDVDVYNRRGEQYYVSQIDTIGTTVENGEDFIYTQQIQKYYNPTIVVDNANALGDVLSNAYGNVEIVINDNGYPVFAPWYGYSWPYYSYVWSPWNWGFSFGSWGWNIGWYDPWYAWNWGWGPSWGWGPVWGAPIWNPGPGWGSGPGPRPMASWSPRGNRTVGPRPGWNSPAPQRGGNMAMGSQFNGYRNPAPSMGSPNRPGTGIQSNGRPTGVVNNGGRWQYNTTGQTGHRTAGTGVVPGNSTLKNSQSNTRPNSTVSNSNNRNTVTNNTRNNSTTNRSTVTTGRNNSGSFGGGRSSGGGRSTGGGSRGGGGGRHR